MTESQRARDIADAVLIVIKTVVKWVVVVVVVVAVIISLFLAYSQFVNERERSEREDALVTLKKSVVAIASFDASACDRELPFKVEFRNRSDKTVESISFHLYVKRVGRSTVISREYEKFVSDIVLKPGKGTVVCWQVDDNTSFKPLVADDGPFDVAIEVTEIKTSEVVK